MNQHFDGIDEFGEKVIVVMGKSGGFIMYSVPHGKCRPVCVSLNAESATRFADWVKDLQRERKDDDADAT